MYYSLRKQPTFRDSTDGLPAKWRLRNERRNSILMTRTLQIWVVLLIDQSEALPRSRYWRVISMEFLRSFLRRHFARKPLVMSRNVSCFLRLLVWQLHVISVVCLHGCKLAGEREWACKRRNSPPLAFASPLVCLSRVYFLRNPPNGGLAGRLF